MKIISRKVLIVTGIVSTVILLFLAATQSIYSRSYIFICNYNSAIEGMIVYNTEKIVMKSLNDRNIYDCLGKNLPFYQRNIDYYLSNGLKSEGINFFSRYKVLNSHNPDFVRYVNNKYLVLSDKQNVVIIRKVIDIGELTDVINTYKPSVIMVSNSMNTDYLREVGENKNIEIIYVSEGSDLLYNLSAI